MRKPKRKYIRKIEPVPPQSTTDGIKEQSSSQVLSEVTQADIDRLPPSLKHQLGMETRRRKGMADNLKERTETMVRRFRGW